MSSRIPTPHNGGKAGEIAGTVIMCGDPLRAKFIADTYLEGAEQFNAVRGMYGYTGQYKGHRISVMGHGMGIPSIGIYTYELYNFYGVETIIRVGSAGGIADSVHVRDIVMAMAASTDSNYASQFALPGMFAPTADFELLRTAAEIAQKNGISVKAGNILSSDIYYNDDLEANLKWKKMNVLAVEMEAAALYMNAARAGKKALCICTISNNVFSGEELSTEERQTGFGKMIEVALETAISQH